MGDDKMAPTFFQNFKPQNVILKAVLMMLLIKQANGHGRTNDLRRLLFAAYDPQDIPTMPVNVTSSLNLLSLNSLDIKQQRLSIAAYFFFQWHDPRLIWLTDPTFSPYFGVRSVFSEEVNIWTPPIIIENSVDDIDVISRPNVPIRVDGLGMVSWFPAGIFTTHCDSMVTYWPLDTQICEVIISTWAVTSLEVYLDFGARVMVSSSYEEHGEWELVAKSNMAMDVYREGAPFRRLIFTLTFRRRHLFHTLNTLLPVILFGFLTIVVFKLNPESGERVGLALTILLAYAVYLGLISESIPQTSLSASLLSTYLAIILLLQTLSVLLTVIYLDIFFTSDEKPIPKWVQRSTQYLARLACGKTKVRNKAKVWPQREGEKANIAAMTVEDVDKNETYSDVSEDEPKYQYTWKDISRMLDRVTMYIYVIFLFGLTIVIGGIMIHHYINTAFENDTAGRTE